MHLRIPTVAVLMTTYNSKLWLHDQVQSILEQEKVQIKLFVSDDFSDDGTWELLQKIAKNDNRITLLSKEERFGDAGKNFFRMVRDSDISGCDYVAYSDHDDIWHADKLIHLTNVSRREDAAGVSSNVRAFWANGKSKLIQKSQPQRNYDYLFESAGPGCTFLMSKDLIEKVREELMEIKSVARDLALHDWLTYAICRASGKKWVIDPRVTVNYRQHAENVIGANSGLRSKLSRIKRLQTNWYRKEVIKICKVCSGISSDPIFPVMLMRLERDNLKNRVWLLLRVSQFRRSILERFFLGFAIFFGLF